MLRQVGGQPVHGFEIGRAHDGASAPFLDHKAGLGEGGKMMRHRRRGDAHVPLHLTDDEAIPASPVQQAEYA